MLLRAPLLAVLLAGLGLGLGLGVGSAHAQVRDTGQYLSHMDANGDGRVSLDEYLAWMLESFDAMDRNRDGVLDASEHPGAARRPIRREDYRANLVEGFRRQDRNGDGYLDARELAAPPQR